MRPGGGRGGGAELRLVFRRNEVWLQCLEGAHTLPAPAPAVEQVFKQGPDGRRH